VWSHFAHQADIGIKVTADSLPGAFEEAAIALTAIVTEPVSVESVESVKIECSAENNELLLVDWLSAVIYEMAVRKMLFSRFEVTIDPAPLLKSQACPRGSGDLKFQNGCRVENLKLSAKMWGEKINQNKHSPAVEPKAVTYNQLSVKNEPALRRGLAKGGNDKWIVQCVIDV
jgi:tRNA nucleotidyltransferase (CCA-adding enzyme)